MAMKLIKAAGIQPVQPLFPTITLFYREWRQRNGTYHRQVLKNTDTRIHNDMRVNPAFLFAVMFWYPLLETAQKIAQESGLAYYVTRLRGDERCAR